MMGLSTETVARACERIFARVCEVGQAVPAGTPAAGFLAAAARHVDEAQTNVVTVQTSEDLGEVLRLLAQSSKLLGEVARLTEHEVVGLDRVRGIIDGLYVTLEMDERDALQTPGHEGSG